MQRQLLLMAFCLAFLNALADDRTLVRGEYWFDDQQGSRVSVNITNDGRIDFMADASALPEGMHRLNYRAVDSEGNYSALQTWLFFRYVPESIGEVTLEYWIDEKKYMTLPVTETAINFQVDASACTEGLHRLNYRLKTDGGDNGAISTWMFYKLSNAPRATSLKWYRVWWNNHQDKAIEVQLPSGTAEYLYEETLAVPDYARNDDYSRNNIATFHVVFCDDLGQLSPVESAEVPYPDIYPPRTKLTATIQTDSVSLTWLANKDNVRDYNVYYSENNQPYVLWLPNITRTDAVFRGQKGSTYRFLVTARDDKGNYEAMEESKAVKVEFK